jgi:CBS domain containing-hemolysin-like protein
MGFNKYFIPEPDALIRQIIETGPTRFMVHRSKTDAVIGNSDSIKIFDHVHERLLDQKSDSDIVKSLKLKFPKYFNETN